MIDYDVGDIVLIRHGNSKAVKCLVVSIKKRHNFYEVELLGNGKTFTIVDDENFYSIKTLVKNEKRTSK